VLAGVERPVAALPGQHLRPQDLPVKVEAGGESLEIDSVLASLDGQVDQARRVLLPLG
jgi:hypothetical protein